MAVVGSPPLQPLEPLHRLLVGGYVAAGVDRPLELHPLAHGSILMHAVLLGAGHSVWLWLMWLVWTDKWYACFLSDQRM